MSVTQLQLTEMDVPPPPAPWVPQTQVQVLTLEPHSHLSTESPDLGEKWGSLMVEKGSPGVF